MMGYYLFNLLCALSTWIVSISGMSDNFYFLQHPKFPDKVTEGQELSLACQVSESDHIVYHWLHNNKPIINTPRRYQNSTFLIFKMVHRGRDEGQYQCQAHNTSSEYSVSSFMAELTVGWIGSSSKVLALSPTTTTHNLHEGNSILLQCVVEGSGFQVTWYRNSVKVYLDDRVTVDDVNRTLRITSLSVHDNGVYSCEMSNEAGITVFSQKNVPVIITRPDIVNILLLPQDIIVNKGASAQFDCVFDGKETKVEWYNRDQETPMRNTTKSYTIFPNGTLFFHKVRSADVGSYRCVGLAGGMHDGDEVDEVPSTLGYIAELKMFVRPEISRNTLFPIPTKDNKYILSAGSTLEVFCNTKAPSQPPSIFTWINGKKEVLVNGTFLLIESVQPSHAGDYTCRAENGVGAAEEYTVNLVVTILPIISQEPETSITVDEEGNFQLFCSYKGSPGQTNITWMRSPPRSTQSHNITETSRHKITNRDTTSQLFVQRTVAGDDSGNYRCQVTTMGFEPVYSETASVLVRERLKFTAKPLNQHLELSSKAKIHCRAQATEGVKVRWTKLLADHRDKSSSGKASLPQHLRADRNGTLWFDGVKKEDEGLYVCTAETRSEMINVTARIEVVVSPQFTVHPPGDVMVVVGQSVIMDCQAVGDPIPAIHWDKEGRANTTESARWSMAPNGSLIIENVRPGDSGHYGCTAGNKGGFKREEVELTVQQESNSSVAYTLIITMSCAVGYIILVLCLVVYCKRKRCRKSQPESNPLHIIIPEPIIQTSYSQPESAVLLPKYPPPSLAASSQQQQQQAPYQPPNSSILGKRTPSHHLYASAQHYASASDDGYRRNSPNNISSAYSSAVNSNGRNALHNRSRRELQNPQTIGRGQFGKVFTASIDTLSSSTLVMVKMLQTRDEDICWEFKVEYETYRKLNHPHVVRCLGLCQPSRDLMEWSIYEHTKAGNLKSFLMANTELLNHSHLVDFARQIAEGMEYLDVNRHVHRDLAARNCVVDVLGNGDLWVKIGNLGLSSESIHEQEYCLYRNRRMPVRWMPAEVVFEDEFSCKSDVWSFGVVCYELFTLCQIIPYDELVDGQVVKQMEDGTLRQITDHDHDDYHLDVEECSLIRRCMAKSPPERPTFQAVLSNWKLMNHQDNHV